MTEPEQPGSDENSPIESPPDGSVCAEHPDRPALAVCPRCGGYACLGCWHHPIRRCHACLMRDPAAAAPPIPWEDPAPNGVVRFFGTITSALRPTTTAPAFARDDVARARWFWALSFLPLAVLSAIVPSTHTLLFGPSFAVRIVGGADGATIALDVVRAVGIGVLVSLVAVLALALPYVSLTRAYAEKGYEVAPLRVVLYRAFLLPLSQVLLHVVVWSLPQDPTELASLMAAAAQMLPLVLLFWALRATARMASGVGPLASYLAAIVPFVVMVLAQEFLGRALSPLMPDPEQLRQAIGSMAAAGGAGG